MKADHFENDELSTFPWAIPLDEPLPLATTPLPLPEGEPMILAFALQDDDAQWEGYQPRLRRFDEAA